jgi:hypothetical protein
MMPAAESPPPLHATWVSTSEALSLYMYKEVAGFAPLLVDVEALLPSMRQLLRIADSPDTIVAPAELVETPKNELEDQT